MQFEASRWGRQTVLQGPGIVKPIKRDGMAIVAAVTKPRHCSVILAVH
jgi:hypothetical protein